MTIRSRTWQIVLTVTAILALSLVITTRALILDAFTDLEHNLSLQNMRRAVNTLNASLEKLNATTGDYSSWDDTYAFMLDTNISYIETNFLAESFANIDVGCMLFYSAQRKLFYQACFEDEAENASELPLHIRTSIEACAGLLSQPDSSRGISGILVIDSNVVKVAARPVLKNDYSGPSRGTMVCVQYLDQAGIAAIGDAMDMDISLIPLEDAVSSGYAASDMQEGKRFSISATGNNLLHGYALIDDINGSPALLLHSALPRPIFAAGRRTLSYTLAWLLGIVAVFALVVLLLLDRGVLSRLSWTRHAVDTIKQYPEPSRRIEVTGSDEFSTLASDINNMLAAIEQARKQAAKSEDRYQLLFSEMLNAFAIYEMLYDTQGEAFDYRIIEINPAFERLSDIRRDTVIGKTILELLPSTTAEWLDRYSPVVASGQPIHFEAYSVLLGRHLEVMAFKAGEHTAGVTFTDITDRKQAEKQREEAQTQLAQLQKMEAIGQLAGGLAHDLNNQMGAVLGYADLLRDHVREDTRMLRFVNNMIIGVKRATDLTSQLLAFARKGKYLTEAVDMHKIVDEVLSLLEHSLDKKIIVHKRLAACHPVVQGDPSQLQNVVLNLAINARDAMPQGGALSIGSEVVELGDDFCRRHPHEVACGTYLCLSVTDTGSGMNKETQRRAFEPFFTTKPVGQGTGMGLAAAYGTVKNHHGAITIYSETEHGTTVNVYLPIATSEETPHRPEPDITRLPGEPHILIIDDEPLFSQMAEDLLSEMGCRISQFHNGKDAIEFYCREWCSIDIVLLDLIMPGMGGREVYQRLQKINPNIIAVVSSGYSLNGEVQQMIDRGVVAFVKKPYRRGELGAVLLKLMETRHR